LLFAIALFAGCNRTPVITPTKLAHQIADTDWIVARHYIRRGRAHVPPDILNFSVTIIGNDARKVVRAVSRSTWDGAVCDCIPVWELQFYKGSNWLATVDFESDLLWGVDVGQFDDTSGTLKKLDRAIDAQTHRIPVPTNGTIGPLSSY
jgi:hypothetical protein